MNNLTYNENGAELATYETPFADSKSEFSESREQQFEEGFSIAEFETPFSQSFEFTQEKTQNPLSNDYVSLLAELNDHEFENAVYELVAEMEDNFSGESPLANETISYYTQNQAQEHFQALVNETHKLLDQAEAKFSGNNLADINETEVERFFNEWEVNRGDLSIVQEEFLGKLVNKVKSVVNTGINLAKKGVAFVGSKLLGPLLSKLKSIIMPLLKRVLKVASGKLPAPLRPFAASLAKKFLNLDISETAYENNNEFANESYEYDREADHEADHEFEIPATANISEIQAELDHQLANLVFAETEAEAETIISNYVNAGETYETYSGETYETLNQLENSIEVARQNFIQELQNLQPGESPAPAIERFLPAIYPIVKGVITIIGRQRVINFLAGLLANLVSKWVPKEVSKPLATAIIDTGARIFGFETNEAETAGLAYEAIANTIQETVQNLTELNETLANDKETATAQVLEAFEIAAANNFPAQYIKTGLRPSASNGLWISRPRKGAAPLYKKYSKVFDVTLSPQMARNVKVWRGLPLANFLRDKFGLDVNTPVRCKVHLYEAIQGTTLSRISRTEKVYGLNGAPHSWKLILPATKNALSVLINEPGLGRNFSRKYLRSHTRIAVGQRFFYIEIPGSNMRFNPCTCPRHLPALQAGTQLTVRPYVVPGVKSAPGKYTQSSDMQVVINFIKSEIRFNYYFSEEDAKIVAEKLNRNDFIGAAMTVRNSLRSVLHGILLKNIGSKVKIIHEMVPELYLENIANENQQETAGGIVLNAGKAILAKIIDKLVNRMADVALKGVVSYFKARAAEFKQAQSTVHDGVTLKITWVNIPRMSKIRALINAIRGKASLGNLADLALPSIPTPEVTIRAGKKFD